MSYNSDFKPRPNIAQEMSKQYMQDFMKREEEHLAANKREGTTIPHPEYMEYKHHCETNGYVAYEKFKEMMKEKKPKPSEEKKTKEVES